MRAWAGVALALVAGSVFAATSGMEVDTLLKGLAAVPAARARFVETKTSALLGAPLVLQGRLAYRRPVYLERHVLAPYDERTVIDGDRVTIESATAGKRQLTVPPGPARALLESTRATLAGDRAVLERHYALQASGSTDAWQLALTPRDPALAALVARIVFTGTLARIVQIDVFEASGDRTSTTIADQ